MVLTAAQMAQMSRLLDEALELDTAGRRSWLEALSPEYQELEPALRQALLPEKGQSRGAEGLATLPKIDAGEGKTELGSGLQPGECIGPYLLVRPLGEGGMAEVWLAQRADGAFKREVALKLPMLSRRRKDLASRFARERDILASLEHPNIARLYDAGVSAEGLPYLAMEYVHGEPLTGWCDTHRLSIRERLRLFLQVLDAVQYAHGHQVIHRDIKPSNILVTDSGQVRLLDFGVAKLLAEDGEHTELTQLYGRALTPEYASPELVRGEPIGAAADVYSLGVVLYELLTGSRPYRLKAGASVLQLEQAIATAQIERPSTQVGKDAGTDRSTTQDKLARRLRGDLDAIVMKALAKAPKDRYDSATALADDLQRYLSGEPVEARPDRLTYRLTKFVLRHRNGVALSVAAVVLVAATIGFELTRPVRGPGVAHPAPSATQTTAAAVSDKSIAVLPFVDMSEKKDQEYFSDGLSEELIDHLAHATDLKVIARTSSFQFKGKNEDMRSIASKLGVAHLLEGSVRKEGRTLRITAQLIRASDGSHLWSQTYDRNISGIFKLQDEIAGTVAQALKATLDISGTHPEVKTPNEEAHNLVLEGNFFLARESESDTQKAVDLYKQAIRLDPGYAMPWARLAVAYKNQGFLGWIPYADGTAKAKQAAQRSLQLDPNLVLAHYARLVILNDVDWDWAAAQAEVERIREIDPTDVFTLPKAEAYLAIIFGRVDEAIRIYRRILELDPLNSSALGNLAWAQYDANHLDDSVATWRRLIQVSPESFGNQAFMGIALTLLGQNEQALAAIEKESHEGIKQWALSIAYWSAGRKADSERALNKYKKDDAGNVYACFVAEIYAYRGDVDSAFEWLDRSYKHHGAGLESIKSDPLLRNLHSDPRFRELLVKMKLDGDGPQVDH